MAKVYCNKCRLLVPAPISTHNCEKVEPDPPIDWKKVALYNPDLLKKKA